jgi:(2S)-methylsuccinyl-CoA dehydrogenase
MQASDDRACGPLYLALVALERYLAEARGAVLRRVSDASGRVSSAAMAREQRAVHGLAWTVAYARALTELDHWLAGLARNGQLDEVASLIGAIGAGEYLAQILGGIPMSQSEIIRAADMGADEAAVRLAADPSVTQIIRTGNTPANRIRLHALIESGHIVQESFGDDTLDMIRAQFRRFAQEAIRPHAHGWHLRDALIPDDVIAQMGKLGVFGVTIAQSHGGMGLGKLAMCVVSEELSRGFLAAGSLGTRSEIAGELIGSSGTDAQRMAWLEGIARGTVLPCAMFTEPDTGSDLASLRTRGVRAADGGWRIHGAKTWSTHGARSDLMTLLVRTDPDRPGHDGLSMMLAPKPRGSDALPFPAKGMSGSEIPVLGYRGMKEYEIAFEDFAVPADGLLGGQPGQGFRQLMQTFESARIQTAARALGVAWDAFDVASQYARTRRQFGRAIAEFPRVHDKLAMMLVETVIARELTYFAARTKDTGRRCDLEAGMAKLLAARVAWSNADSALQIHGGNGYALEYEASRIFCDARILNIFEGAGEIQAQVIGRRLLD